MLSLGEADFGCLISTKSARHCFNLYYDGNASTDDEDDLPECLSWTKEFEEYNSKNAAQRRTRRGRPTGYHPNSSRSTTRQRAASDTAAYSSRTRQRDQTGESSSRYRGRRAKSSSTVASGNHSPRSTVDRSRSRTTSHATSRTSSRRKRQTSAERRYREEKRAAAEAKRKEATQRQMQAMFFTAMRLKAIAKRFMVKPEEKNRAAIKIQRSFRHYLTKAKETRAEEKRRAKERRREQKLKAAMTIYSAVVRYMATAKERRAEEKRKAKAKRRAQKYNALVKIQAAVRTFLVKTEDSRMQAKHDFAAKIQSAFRRYMVITEAKRAAEKRIAEEKWAQEKRLATMKVKGTVRRYMFSVKFMNKLEQKKNHDLRNQAIMKVKSTVRRYMLSVRFMTKLEEKRDHDLRVAQQNEIDSIKARIDAIHRDAENKVGSMRNTMETEKERLRKENQRKVDSLMSTEDVLDSLDAEMRMLDEEEDNKKEIAKLEKQSEELKASIEEMQEMITGINEENSDLQKANEEIRDMFTSLNTFARKKFEDKKKLAAAQNKYAKELLPKVKRDVTQGTKASLSENKVKEGYRHSMYRVLQGVQASERYDQILYDDVLYMIRECETSLGAKVLDTSGSLDYMDTIDAAPIYEGDSSGGNWNNSQNWHSMGSSQFFDSSGSNFDKSRGHSIFDASTNTWNDSKNWRENKDSSRDDSFSEGTNLGDSLNFDSGGVNRSFDPSQGFGESMNFDDFNKNCEKSKNLSAFFSESRNFGDDDEDEALDEGRSDQGFDGNDGAKIDFSNAGVNWDALSAWTDD